MKRLFSRRFVRDALLTGGAQFAQAALAMVAGILVARLLGASARGTVSVLVALGSITVLLASFGVHYSAVYFLGRFGDRRDEVASNNTLVGIAGGVAGALVLALVGLVFRDQLLGSIPLSLFLLYVVAVPFSYYRLFGRSLALGGGRVGLFNLPDVLEGVGLVVATPLLIVAFGGGVRSLVAMRVVLECGIALLLFFGVRRALRFRFRPSRDVLREQVAYGVRNYASALFWIVLLQGDLVLCNHFLGSAPTGIYSVAVSLGLPVTMLATVFGALTFQRASAASSRELRIANANRTTRLLVPLLALTALAVGGSAHWLVPVVFGSEFSPATTALALLLPGLVALSLEVVLISFLLGEGSPPVVYWAPALGVVLNLGANLFAIPTWGINGAAVTSSIGYAIVFALVLREHLRMSGSSVVDVLVPRGHDFRAMLSPHAPSAPSPRGLPGVRRPAFDGMLPSSATVIATVVTAVVCLVAAALVSVSGEAAVVLAAAGALMVVAGLVHHRYIVAALLAYFPLQELAMTYAPGRFALVARYAPEAIVYLLAAGLLLTRFAAVVARLGALAGAIAVLVLFWTGSGVWNGIGAGTIAAGLRSEWRFLPLVVLPLFSLTLRRDARLYGRTLLLFGGAEAVLAMLEFFGGEAMRRPFAPNVDIALAGTSVGSSSPPLDTIFGTFSHRNSLGIFLVLTWVVLVGAGASALGLTRRRAQLAGLVLLGGVVASASREAFLALIASTLVIGIVKYGMPAVRGAVLVAGVCAVALAVAGPPKGGDNRTDSFSGRWGDVLSPRGWDASPTGNFRLYFMVGSGEYVAHNAPLGGFGLGTISDPRAVNLPSSPLWQYDAGRLALRTGFFTDSNWVELLLEVGLVGVLLLAYLLFRVFLLGKRFAKSFWPAAALAGLVPAIGVIGLFAPVLQLRPAAFVLSLLVGAAAGHAYATVGETEEERDARSPARQRSYAFGDYAGG